MLCIKVIIINDHLMMHALVASLNFTYVHLYTRCTYMHRSVIGVGLIGRAQASSFYSEYHRVLRDMGVDGVKVDAQSILPSLVDER